MIHDTLRLIPLATALAAATAHAALLNGSFDDTSGAFPAGWTRSANGTITPGASLTGDTGSAAVLTYASGMARISQDFAPSAADALADFRLDFAFSTSSRSTSINFDLLDGTGAAIVALRLNGSGQIGVSDAGTFHTLATAATLPAVAVDTPYLLRITGANFDTAARTYTLALSADGGATYATSLALVDDLAGATGGFAGTSPRALEGVRFTAGATGNTLRIDAVSVAGLPTAIPEPACAPACAIALAAGLLAVRRRRR